MRYRLVKPNDCLRSFSDFYHSCAERILHDAQSGDDGVYILEHATVNNNRFATKSTVPGANTGLVYADYYFLEAGNCIIEMGPA
jgi:hypothetical protein